MKNHKLLLMLSSETYQVEDVALVNKEDTFHEVGDLATEANRIPLFYELRLGKGKLDYSECDFGELLESLIKTADILDRPEVGDAFLALFMEGVRIGEMMSAEELMPFFTEVALNSTLDITLTRGVREIVEK